MTYFPYLLTSRCLDLCIDIVTDLLTLWRTFWCYDKCFISWRDVMPYFLTSWRKFHTHWLFEGIMYFLLYDTRFDVMTYIPSLSRHYIIFDVMTYLDTNYSSIYRINVSIIYIKIHWGLYILPSPRTYGVLWQPSVWKDLHVSHGSTIFVRTFSKLPPTKYIVHGITRGQCNVGLCVSV